MFQNDPTNRNVTSVRKLVRSMERYGFIPAYPIHVVPHNGKLYVRDGAHRLEAAIATEEPVYYVVCDQKDISIPEINDAARHWSAKDYIDSYVRTGNKEFAILKKFADEHRISYIAAAFLLSGRQTRSSGDASVYGKIKDGSFRVTNYTYAHRVASIIGAIRKQINIATNGLFVNALSRTCLVKTFDGNRFVKNALRCHASFTSRATLDDYLDLIEDVYNDHARFGRLPIKFLANEASKDRSSGKLHQ
jgi:hypothetical protein